jgi:hypothetical protein
MASPFRYFRKHTKVFMATAAVLAIFLFVFASGVGGGSSSDDRRPPTATVATWNGGSINEGQLISLVYQRRITDEFLQRLFAQGGGMTGYDLPSSVPNLLLGAQRQRDDVVEAAVVETEVFASLAEDAGMTVSDDMINHYLAEFGLNRVNGEDIAGILASLGNESARAYEAIVFNTLRKLLLSHFYRRSYTDASAVVLPEQRWDDWRRVNEQIALEAAALPVEEFLDQTPAPTNSQLRALYNDYRDTVPDLVANVGGRVLPVPTPGFAEPQRVKLQYLTGSVPEKTQQLLDSVTEREIADYYERNKRLEFIKTDFTLDDEESDSKTDTGEEGAAETAPEGDLPTDGGAAAVEETPAATGDSGDPDNEIDSAEATTETPVDATTEPQESAEETLTEPMAEEAAPSASGEDHSSSRPRRSPFRLVALQANPTDTEGTANQADQSSAASMAEAADAAPTEPAGGEPADSATAEAESGEDSDTVDSAAADEEDATPADESAGSDADGVEPPPIQYEPLEKVQDEIREILARDKAVDELQRIMGEATAKLQAEYNRYGVKVAQARELKKPIPPAPEKLRGLDWLAKEYGLTAQQTALLTDREVLDLPVGKAVDDQTGRMNVAQALFLALDLYEPFLAKDITGDRYLVAKIEDQPKRVPTFDEARDKVAAAWKRIEAAKLAEKKAKELADELETSTQPFAEFFADKGYDVIPQTELFSWRSYLGGMPGQGYPAGLGDIPELKNIGEEFMQVAFGLKENEAAGLLNYDHTVAYVIRLHTRQYTEEQLKKLFLDEEEQWLGRFDMGAEHQMAFNQLVMQRVLEDEAGFKFDEEWEERREAQLEERR